MTPAEIVAIRTDFAVLAPQADAFAERFYERLFALDPALRPLFPTELAPQRKKLLQALAVVVTGLDRLDALLDTLRELGRRHAGYGVETHHYAVVGEALLATLAERVTDFGDRNRSAWSRAYATLAEVMSGAPREEAA